MNNNNDENLITLSGCIIVNNNQELLLFFNKNHNFYETPNGKVNSNQIHDENDLKELAKRELFNTVGSEIEIKRMEYFSKSEFIIHNSSKRAIAHKFIVEISGSPKLMNNRYSKFEAIHESDLTKNLLSPDLKIILGQIKSYFYHENIYNN